MGNRRNGSFGPINHSKFTFCAFLGSKFERNRSKFCSEDPSSACSLKGQKHPFPLESHDQAYQSGTLRVPGRQSIFE